jgi:uncharacterized phiE125 gp8 family phage protein
MEPVIVTPPAAEPVSVAEAKAHLVVEHSDDDALIASLVTAARQRAESVLGRVFVTTEFDWVLDGWPVAPLFATGRVIQTLNMPLWPRSEIRPVHCPLVSVTSIEYLDPTGASVTLDPAAYEVIAGTPGRILPAYQTAWPVVRPWPGSITVRYVAGYGPDASTVPDSVKAAIKLMVGGWYEQRAHLTAGALDVVPAAVDWLLAAADPGIYR